jgi:hypothetical protein
MVAHLLSLTPRFSGVMLASAHVRTVLTVSRVFKKLLKQLHRRTTTVNTLLKQGVNEISANWRQNLARNPASPNPFN